MTGLRIGTNPQTTIVPPQWETVGAWQAGTVVGVALTGTAGRMRGLLASRAGVYGWTPPESKVEPHIKALSDLNIVAVAFAGGDETTPAMAIAASASGRLFRTSAKAGGFALDEWQEIRTWAGLGVAVVLAPSPAFAADQTLFVGTPAGIFRTQDQGENWESCNFGLLDEDVLAMVCAPNFAESELLWAGTAGGGLYRSRNSARAWRESGMGLPDAAVQSLSVSPNYAEDHTLYAGMEAHGVYVSRDGGESWSRLALDGLSVNTLACPHEATLWAGTEDGLWSVTTGNGEVAHVVGAGETVMSVAATAEGQVAIGLFGSGLWLTTDATRKAHLIEWQKPNVALHAPPIVATAGGDVFALDSDGFMARSMNGAQWLEMESASPDNVFALRGGTVLTETGADTVALFAATETGLTRWDSETEAWQEVAGTEFAHHTALGVALSPRFSDDRTLLVMAHDNALLVSHDNGVTWDEITGPWQGQSLLHAHFAPARANEIVALTVQPNETGNFSVAVWQTHDQGRNWEVLAGLTSSVPAVIMAWPQDEVENTVFLATQHRVIKLYSQGEPSTLQVYQHFFDESLRVTAMAVAPDYAQTKNVWAATTDGVYHSGDGGASWELMIDLPHDLPLVWLEVTDRSIHAVTLGGHAWRASLSES